MWEGLQLLFKFPPTIDLADRAVPSIRDNRDNSDGLIRVNLSELPTEAGQQQPQISTRFYIYLYTNTDIPLQCEYYIYPIYHMLMCVYCGIGINVHILSTNGVQMKY